MIGKAPNIALQLVDTLISEGKAQFTFEEAVARIGRSPTATANLLARMQKQGLLDRVRRGYYAIRPLGVLGTTAAAEDVSLAVGTAFAGIPHRIGYRSALDEHDLLAHPSRSIQVAASKRVRTAALSGRPLRVILEPEEALEVGAEQRGTSRISNIERALLDAAARPELVGGAAVLAEALSAAAGQVDLERLVQYAKKLSWMTALRRIGSLADALSLEGIAGKLSPLHELKGDIDLEPGADEISQWRDAKWRVRWPQTREEMENVVRQ